MERIVVAVAGDSISAGSPLWDPDPAVRTRIRAPDELPLPDGIERAYDGLELDV